MRFFLYTFSLLILAAFASGCKKSNPDIESLITIVNNINATPDRLLNNGNILNNCKFEAGDTVLTYNITVSDKRYDGLSNDSIKTLLINGLDSKLVKIIARNNIGLLYNLKMPDKEEVILINAAELK